MLSNSELSVLEGLRRSDEVDEFIKEQHLRSRASKAQQLRVYGYWRRGKAAEAPPTFKAPRIAGECTDHYGETCLRCDDLWDFHSGHMCSNGEEGHFRGCEGL